MIKFVSSKYSFSTHLTSHNLRGRHRPINKLEKGQSVSLFQLTHRQYYKDFDMIHMALKHKEHQSNIHTFQCSEENNTVSVLFKTINPPKPAINYALQKLLLCGSHQYPVRNLTQEMNKRSFSLMSPAQTTDDHLMFTFNTPILKDFNNLFAVYTSMLFNPLLREQDFYQVVRRLTYQQKTIGFSGELAAELHSNQFNIDQTIYSLISTQLLGERPHSLCKPLDLLDIDYQELIKYYQETITLPNCTFILHGDMNIHHFVDQYDKNMKELKPNTHPPIFYPSKALQKKDRNTIKFQHLKQETVLMLSYQIKNATPQENTLLEILSYLLFDMPQSPFLKFNSPETPYPNFYGFHQRYFNIGITFQQPQYTEQKHLQTTKTFRQRQNLFLQKQKQILETLNQIISQQFNNKMIQKCLMHLQNNYYQKKGIKIIESIASKILNGQSLDTTFQVSSLITKLLKQYRRENVFQKLLEKFIISNQSKIVLRGFHNPNIMDQEDSQNQLRLMQIHKKLPSQQLQLLANYSSPNMLQDFTLLPEISPHQLEVFEDTSGQPEKIADINTIYSARYHGNKFTFKFDLTDIGEDDLPLLSLFCKAFPQMGYSTIKDSAYHALLQAYIGKLQMTYETVKNRQGQLKIQVYLTIQFTDRNYQYAISILNGLFTQFNSNNLTALSRALHLSASHSFHQISDNILHVHGVHLASSQSPFLFFQNPLFQTRTLCGLAAQMKKVLNPKGYLSSLGFKMNQIWSKMMGWSRIELLWECHPDKKKHYRKYLNILLSQIHNEGISPLSINVSEFPKQKWQKYFPNFEDELVFQAFSIPYRQKYSPECLVLSSIINQNIQTFNKTGGCFVYKGALVSFLAGTRTKFIQLQDYYRKIENIDVSKRRIFQSFDRYTVQHQFKTGIGFSQARNFKQAVLSVQKQGIQHVLNEYLLKPLKEDNSSILSLGKRLENYEPLMKKGWEIQRSVDDLSLEMESLSRQEVKFEPKKYVDIC